ncbi:MAG TPA: ATP-binding protein [Longilinea sp.]|nr:ATP-binding protein [Longilinea sp.]
MAETSQLTPEALVPRLGDYLVEKGLIQPEDLEKALAYQTDQRSKGENPRIGQVLVALGFVDQGTLEQSITEQIISLRNALTDANAQLEKRVQQRTAMLEKALGKLNELNVMKSNFVANISHELRTPLTHMVGYLELLRDEDLGPISTEQKSALMVMTTSAQRLEKLINDLILFSSSESGQMALQISTQDFCTVIAAVVDKNRSKAKEQQLDLIFHYPAFPIFVDIDEEKIAWVLEELLVNAIKFTPDGGQIQVILELQDQFARVAVKDNGIGIPEEKIGDVFEPFHQLDGSSSRHYGGTGLGLNLAQKILDAHGTTFQVESEPSKGSEFSFLLPIVNSGTK